MLVETGQSTGKQVLVMWSLLWCLLLCLLLGRLEVAESTTRKSRALDQQRAWAIARCTATVQKYILLLVQEPSFVM